jgi:4-amino-4-deoxy-L-arabinose transferase-like glycosyltransferase
VLKSSRFAQHRRRIIVLSTRSQRLLLLLLIFLVAAFARIWHLQDAPPGLQHDELFKAQEGRAIVENGDWRFFYPSNQGHEGGYVWLLALSYLLLGANVIMIKMPAFWAGMLTLAMLYRFARETQNHRVGVMALALAAVSFWMMSTNRVGLRANLLPLVTLIVLWGLWRVCFVKPQQPGRRWRIALLTGIVLGFAIYTYTASFTLYITVGIFLLGMSVLDRATLRRRFPELALIVFLGLMLTLPMLNARLNDPEGQNRASTIAGPWDKFMDDGDPGPLLDNARLLIGMPIFSGDPEWRYNFSERPLFLPFAGVLVYTGFLLMLWRSRRQPMNVALLALALVGLIPSLLTNAAPSFLRSIITLPSLMIFIAISIDWLNRFRVKMVWAVALIVIAATMLADWNVYFNKWPQRDEVHTVYRDDLEQLAAYLQQNDEQLVFVSTEAPAILDPAIFRFLNPPSDTEVVFFDGRVDMVLNDEPTLLFFPPGELLAPVFWEWLGEYFGTVRLDPLLRQDGQVAYEVYRLSAMHDGISERLAEVGQWPVYTGSQEISEWGTRRDYPVNMGDVLQLVGVYMPQSEVPSADNGVDNGLQLHLYLQPLDERLSASLSLFVHVVSMDGEVVFGRDFLGVPASQWRTGITFIQDNYLGNYNIPPGRYFVAMGLYETRTGQRFPILDDSGQPIAEQIMLGQFEAVEP